MTDAAQPTLLLHIALTEPLDYRNRPYGRFQAWVCGADVGAGFDGTPYTTLYGHESLFARLALAAYYGNPELAEGRHYGFDYGYEPYQSLVGKLEAERMSKGLAKVARVYERLCDDLGRPQSLGHEVAYVMRAIGMKAACVQLPPDRVGTAYRRWRVLSGLESVRYYIDAQVEDFRQERMPRPAAA
jgi:hypothetical protein